MPRHTFFPIAFAVACLTAAPALAQRDGDDRFNCLLLVEKLLKEERINLPSACHSTALRMGFRPKPSFGSSGGHVRRSFTPISVVTVPDDGGYEGNPPMDDYPPMDYYPPMDDYPPMD